MATKYKQRPDGRYCAKVWDGSYIENGSERKSKHYIFLYSSKSSRDLEKIVKDYENDRDAGRIIAAKKGITIYDYALNWLDTYKALKERATYNLYKSTIDIYFSQFNVDFSYFTLNKMQKLINDNANKPRTCIKIRLCIKQIGEAAESDKLIPVGRTKEITRKLELPKYKSKEKRALTDEEKAKIENCTLAGEEKTFVYLLYYTGMRKGEVLALNGTDIHDGFVHVTKALGTNQNEFYEKSPKTERGVRKIPIVDALQSHLGTLQLSDDKIFTQRTPNSFCAWWKHIRAYFGTDITPHTFRHNFCTQLCYQAATKHTITTKKIAELLGDSEAMVLNVYSHIIEEQEQTEESIRNALKF